VEDGSWFRELGELLLGCEEGGLSVYLRRFPVGEFV
jgi:hypothetical protein